RARIGLAGLRHPGPYAPFEVSLFRHGCLPRPVRESPSDSLRQGARSTTWTPAERWTSLCLRGWTRLGRVARGSARTDAWASIAGSAAAGKAAEGGPVAVRVGLNADPMAPARRHRERR